VALRNQSKQDPAVLRALELLDAELEEIRLPRPAPAEEPS
jgi:hypothetical protein